MAVVRHRLAGGDVQQARRAFGIGGQDHLPDAAAQRAPARRPAAQGIDQRAGIDPVAAMAQVRRRRRIQRGQHRRAEPVVMVGSKRRQRVQHGAAGAFLGFQPGAAVVALRDMGCHHQGKPL
jgi:hypothetical protein